MRDVINAIHAWWQAGRREIAVATVVRTWGSAPRKAGAKFAFTPQHELAGSVSGGCIESAMFEAGQQVLHEKRGQLLEFGVADETAFDTIGLACGGSVTVWIEPVSAQLYEFWRNTHTHDLGWARSTIVDGVKAGDSAWVDECTPPQPDADDPLAARASAALAAALAPALNETEAEKVFVDVELPSPQLICIGAVHIAQTLLPMAKMLGYRTIVVDAREAFATRERMPQADEIVREWPDTALGRLPIHSNTAIVTLTHDEKFDDPALLAALRSRAFYVGALGGKVTRQKRTERLKKAGLSEAELARLHAPIGLNLGAQTPDEIALAALAQMTQARHNAAK